MLSFTYKVFLFQSKHFVLCSYISFNELKFVRICHSSSYHIHW